MHEVSCSCVCIHKESPNAERTLHWLVLHVTFHPPEQWARDMAVPEAAFSPSVPHSLSLDLARRRPKISTLVNSDGKTTIETGEYASVGSPNDTPNGDPFKILDLEINTRWFWL
jgi:hypothetical protein